MLDLLVKRYGERKNNFYFSTPKYELFSEGVEEKVEFTSIADLCEQVGRILKSGRLKNKIIVGALPFDGECAGTLYIAKKYLFHNCEFERRNTYTVPGMIAKVRKANMISEPEHYKANVSTAVDEIKAGEYKKIVLARGIKLWFEEDIYIPKVLSNIYSVNKRGYTYATNLYNDSHIIGASPEMLISKKENQFYSNPLAGSRARVVDSADDRSKSAELCSSDKDLKEHKFVVDHITGRLSESGYQVQYSDKPEILKTKQMLHLSTVIKGEIANNEQQHVLGLLSLIHPTPAICGVPVEKTKKKIMQLEGFERGFYAGAVGWCDEHGDGDWAITLRGAEIKDNQVTAYAGAGIVEDSVPEEELQETFSKLKTMLNSFEFDEEIGGVDHGN